MNFYISLKNKTLGCIAKHELRGRKTKEKTRRIKFQQLQMIQRDVRVIMEIREENGEVSKAKST